MLEGLVELGQDPPALQRRPWLPDCFMPAWECFNELGNDRPAGLGPSAIPWLSIASWARFHGIEDVAGHVALVQACDRAFLDFHEEKRKRGADGNHQLRPRAPRVRR